MQSTTEIVFGDYRLGGPNGPLWRGRREIKLRPRAARLLWVLTQNPGQVLSKAELLDELWPGLVVGQDALRFQIGELRRALQDQSRTPRYIATVHGIGFRFIADVRAPAIIFRGADDTQARLFVGRAAELAALQSSFAQALRGQPRIAFVSGQAGIGKSALAECFLRSIPTATTLVGYGHCVLHTSANEPFAPVLDPLHGLCNGVCGEAIKRIMRAHAPNVLAALGSMSEDDGVGVLQPSPADVTRSRYARELCDVLVMLGEQQVLVLVIEGLDLADTATLDLLARLARQGRRSHLFVLATHPPPELLGADHPLQPLRYDCITHGRALDLRLPLLDAESVLLYLYRRFGQWRTAENVALVIAARCEGHPRAMVQLADHLSLDPTAAS